MGLLSHGPAAPEPGDGAGAAAGRARGRSGRLLQRVRAEAQEITRARGRDRRSPPRVGGCEVRASRPAPRKAARGRRRFVSSALVTAVCDRRRRRQRPRARPARRTALALIARPDPEPGLSSRGRPAPLRPPGAAAREARGRPGRAGRGAAGAGAAGGGRRCGGGAGRARVTCRRGEGRRRFKMSGQEGSC